MPSASATLVNCNDSSTGYSAMDGLVSETYTMLIKTQQEYGLSDRLEIPQLVLVGVQSTGKSTFLESLVGFAITYKQNSTGTRCPTMVTLKPDHSIEEQNGRRVFVNGIETPIGKLESTLRDHMEKVRKSRHGFDIRPVKVEIRAPKVPELVIFDMPGLIPNSDNPDGPKKIEEIVATYVRNPRNIVVVMATCTSDRGSLDGFDRIDKLAMNDSREFIRTTGFPPRKDWAKHALVFVNKWNLQFPTRSNSGISTMSEANEFFQQYSTTNARGVGHEDHVFISLVPDDLPTRDDGTPIKPGNFNAEQSFEESDKYYATLPYLEEQHIKTVKERLSKGSRPGERWNSGVNDAMLGIRLAHKKLTERLDSAILDNLAEITCRVEQLLREVKSAVQNLQRRLETQDETSTKESVHQFLEDFLFHFQKSLDGASVKERWWSAPSHSLAVGAGTSRTPAGRGRRGAMTSRNSNGSEKSSDTEEEEEEGLGEAVATAAHLSRHSKGRNRRAPTFQRGSDKPTKKYPVEEYGMTWAEQVELLTGANEQKWDGYLDPETLLSPEYLGFEGSRLASEIQMRLFGVSAFRRAMTLFQYMLLARAFQLVSRENIFESGNKAHMDNQFDATGAVMQMAIDHLDQAYEGVFWLGKLLYVHFSGHATRIFDHLIETEYYVVLPEKVKSLLRQRFLEHFRKLLENRLEEAREVYSRIYETYEFYRPVDQMMQQLMLALLNDIDEMLPGPDRLGVPSTTSSSNSNRLADELARPAVGSGDLDREQNENEDEKVSLMTNKNKALKELLKTISDFNKKKLFGMADVVAPGQQQIPQVDFECIPYDLLRRSAKSYYCSFVVELTQLLNRIFTAEFMLYLTGTHDNNISHDIRSIACDIVGEGKSKSSEKKWKTAIHNPEFASIKGQLKEKKAAQRELQRALANLHDLARQKPHLVSRPRVQSLPRDGLSGQGLAKSGSLLGSSRAHFSSQRVQHRELANGLEGTGGPQGLQENGSLQGWNQLDSPRPALASALEMLEQTDKEEDNLD